MVFVPGIDPYSAGLDLVGETQGTPKFFAVYTRCKSVGRIVGNPDRLFLTGEGNDGQNRAENFVMGNRHIIGLIGEYRRFYKQTLAIELLGASTGDQTRVGLLSNVDIFRHLFE